jgi:transposase
VKSRKVYPTDVSDEEWEFVAPYLTLMKEDAPQRRYPLRDLFRCRALDGEGGLPVAHAAGGLSALERSRAAGQTLDAGRLF